MTPRTHEWVTVEICPTCSNTDSAKIGRGFNGYGERMVKSGVHPMYHKTSKQGCSCDICGAVWRQVHDHRTDEYMITEIVQEGDLYSEDESE